MDQGPDKPGPRAVQLRVSPETAEPRTSDAEIAAAQPAVVKADRLRSMTEGLIARVLRLTRPLQRQLPIPQDIDTLAPYLLVAEIPQPEEAISITAQPDPSLPPMAGLSLVARKAAEQIIQAVIKAITLRLALTNVATVVAKEVAAQLDTAACTGPPVVVDRPRPSAIIRIT